MNKLFSILICLSFIFGQGNYQILTTPSNFKGIFKIDDFYDNQNYSVFNSSLPGNINLFSATISTHVLQKEDPKNNFFITLKNLDYGTLTDNQSDYNFTANESLVELGFLKENYFPDTDIMMTVGYLKSSIDVFDSDGIYINMIGSSKVFNDDYFNFAFKNFGKVTSSYSDTNIKLPEIISLSYIINNSWPVSILFNYENRQDLNDEVLYCTLSIDINPQLDLYISNHSNKSNLFYGDYIQKLAAGTRIGLSYSNNDNIFNLGFQDLGAAGFSTSLSFSKAIL